MWDWLKGFLSKMFRREAEKDFKIQLNDQMMPWIVKYESISEGRPPWQSEDVRSVGLAGFINDYIAKLVTLDVSIECPDTPRGLWMQEQADYILEVLQEKVSVAVGGCGIMFKPNGRNVDYVKPTDFIPTEYDSNGNITGCVFQSRLRKGDTTFVKLEWHRFEGEVYRISNRAYIAKGDGLGKKIELSSIPEWAAILDEVGLEGVKLPLFSYFKVPSPNRYLDTPLGLPIWHNCLKELEDFDVAWNRKAAEVYDSTHVTFLPEVTVDYQKAGETRDIKLPRFVRSVYSPDPMDSTITEHVATLLTEQRISDLNSILSVIGMKCGLNQGTFVFNENTGLQTATQVEADQQETIRTIERIRKQLVKCLKQLFYALDVIADTDTDLPKESDPVQEINFGFQDITYNFEEDRTNWWKYRVQGDVPAWMYYQRFEGMTEDDAKAMVEEATPKTADYDDFFS